MPHLFVGRRVAFLGALVFLTTGLAASPRQQPASPAAISPSDLDANLVAATRLLRDGRLDEAQAAFQSALEAARQSGNARLEDGSLVGLGDVFLKKALYPQAREYGLRGLEIAERAGHAAGVGRANLLLGVTAGFMGDLSEARSRSEQAIAAFEAANDRLGRSRATLELLRNEKTIAPESQRLMARAIADAHTGGDADLEASAHHALGDGYFNSGDYESALSAYEHASTLYTESHNNAELGAVYNSVGRVYRTHGQFQTALEYQLKALELHEGGPIRFYEMQSLNAVSASYLNLDETDKARTYLERALRIAEQSGSPRIQDFLRANLAAILVAQGGYGRAVDLLEGVLARAVDTNVSQRYLVLSNALRKLGRFGDAIRAADTAIARCLAKEVESGDVDCPEAFLRRAQAQLSQGNATAALSDATAALGRIEDVRARLLPSDFFKQEFVRKREWAYSLTIGLQLQQGRAEAALETAELARSRAFIDLLASRNITLKPTDPLSQLSLTSRGGAPLVPRQLGSAVTASPARATDLVAVARRLKSTLLLYWVTDDKVFIWVVKPDGRVRTARVDVLESKLRALVRATVPFDDQRTATGQKAVATRGGDQFPLDSTLSTAWRELYDVLIRPVRGALPAAPGSRLTIVPHGPLANLPFAALQDERGRYLLEDFTLHYAPAGAVLQLTAARRRADAREGPVLIVADPVVSKAAQLGRPLPALPGARDEARAIAGQLPSGRLTMLMGADATEARVAAAAERKAVVHFATHAIVREDAPFESFLALTPDGATADGLMTAEDVYRLNLDADLVVLSACRSGGGRVSGDGIAAFARAFIYAGTPSVVASVWDVSDHATSTLIATFYREWLAGASKSRALRSAQLQMLRNLRAGRVTVTTAAGPIVLPEHPIFWAGFSLIGEPD